MIVAPKLYTQTNVFWQGNEAEYHTAGPDLPTVLNNIASLLRVDFGNALPDTLTIHIHKDTLDGED